jgi:hypothetical protein
MLDTDKNPGSMSLDRKLPATVLECGILLCGSLQPSYLPISM